jgi:hypothetical protein
MLIIENFELHMSHAKGLVAFANLLFKWDFEYQETYIALIWKNLVDCVLE